VPEEFHVVPPGSKKRQEADAGIECIGCGVCYASCDVVAWNPDYLGPAALNRAWTLVNDVRDGARRAAGGGGRRCGLPFLPLDAILHRALPEEPRSVLGDRGAEAHAVLGHVLGLAPR
jgi:ferredoxin